MLHVLRSIFSGSYFGGAYSRFQSPPQSQWALRVDTGSFLPQTEQTNSILFLLRHLRHRSVMEFSGRHDDAGWFVFTEILRVDLIHFIPQTGIRNVYPAQDNCFFPESRFRKDLRHVPQSGPAYITSESRRSFPSYNCIILRLNQQQKMETILPFWQHSSTVR